MGISSAEWLVAPMVAIEEERAAALLTERFGIEGTLEDLGSNHDRNFRVRTGLDEHGYVFKVFNPVIDRAVLRAQSEATERLARALPELRLPRARVGVDGEHIQTVSVDGQDYDCQLLDYVPGEPIMDSRYLAPRVVARMGELAGRITAGLEGLDIPTPDRPMLWDLRNALEVVEALAPHMVDQRRAERVLRAARAAQQLVERRAARLPIQVIHGDVADNNVVCRTDPDGRPIPVGLIDFGDLTHSWAVAELAVACTSVLHHHGATPASVLPAVRAFHAVRPLVGDELDVLWPLIVLRGCVLVVCGQHAALQDPGNGYATAALDREWAMFEAGASVPAEVMAAHFRQVIGEPAPHSDPPTSSHPLLPELPSEATVLDLSVTSDALHGGGWLDPDAESAVVARALASGGTAVLTRHGECRLTRTRVDNTEQSATLALGVEVHLTSPLAVHAPWAGTVTRHAEHAVTLTAGGLHLVLDGINPAVAVIDGGEAVSGQQLGTVAAQGSWYRLDVQLSRLGTGIAPRFTPPELDAGWLTMCPDPTGLILPRADRPVADTPPEPESVLLERRVRSFATVQEHYFETPPQIERGWQHHLVDTRGRGYLDMLNNVTVLGHGHPRLVEAVHRQWQRLNTNSRFHYASVVELSERLSALLPDGLDTVFLVNSGSEAVDLALRLAWATTGRRDVVAVEEAYHGWTYAGDAISTSTADNPNALATRPAWVHTVPTPNSYRGPHRGPEAHLYGPEAAAVIADLVRSGRPPAAFVCEPYYGNAGGMALPDGYLEQVYAATRESGGLCIADEVQVGYGRLGSHFWGFEQQGVEPDIVAVAKAMGNGHPLGAVITRREIADAYRSQGYFFSSAGGSPVSSVVGLTVLDVLRDEGLQDNARTVGAHLRTRLLRLADKHPLIGSVHGSGLYLGVEFVRDHETREPATEETAAICERLRELGVLMQPTSDRMCVLKIKPPLCLTTTSADVFVDALDDVLTHGW
ncbi:MULTISPECIES: aminotransferase [unclassified Streptomyces]|uniref:aminotransferase n=1 Tax=unclassified Streptomyces TaxID=2593676 RepID=UPI002E18C909|nr:MULTISPECIES: aminotransferase [unclassified Streptomyces]